LTYLDLNGLMRTIPVGMKVKLIAFINGLEIRSLSSSGQAF
jgi:hypothetical protein